MRAGWTLRVVGGRREPAQAVRAAEGAARTTARNLKSTFQKGEYSKAMFDRWLAPLLAKRLRRPYVHLLFGARQTGKSTLLRSLLQDPAIAVDLSDPRQRSRYLAHPGDLVAECRDLRKSRRSHFVFVDEAQSVPAIFDAVQHLYDSDKTRWRFVLCGSSARKLRRTGANLLPGRSMVHWLHPLTLVEHPANEPASPHAVSPLPFPWSASTGPVRRFPSSNLGAPGHRRRPRQGPCGNPQVLRVRPSRGGDSA